MSTDPTTKTTIPLGNPECGICGGDGALPIVPHDAIAPGGPDELPCPLCHPELCNER